MTTEVFGARSGATTESLDERARRAVSNFRSMQPTLSAYARVLTGKSNVRVVAAASDNGSTDGETISFRPPLALGDTTPHERRLCDKRDGDGLHLCPACRIREEILVTIYHEIAHICFESFQRVTEEDKKQAILFAVREAKGKWAAQIAHRIETAPTYKTRDYINLVSLINEYMPFLLNALEDARVNRQLFLARPGVKRMFDVDTEKVFREGYEVRLDDGSFRTAHWNEAPLNNQMMIGCFCKASGYDYSNWFHPDVVRDLNDTELTDLIRQMDTARNARAVYNLTFKVLARLRELGYCGTPQDPDPEPEEEPDADESSEEQSSDSDSVSEDAGESGDSDDSDSSDDASDDGSDEEGEAGSGESSGDESSNGADESDEDGNGSGSDSEESESGDSGGDDSEESDTDRDGNGGSSSSEDMEESGSSSDSTGESGKPDKGSSEDTENDETSRGGLDENTEGSSEAGSGSDESSEPSDGSDRGDSSRDSGEGNEEDHLDESDGDQDQSDLGDMDSSGSQRLGSGGDDRREAGEETDSPEDSRVETPHEGDSDEESTEDGEPLDTGADDGYGGTKTEQQSRPEMGSVDDLTGVIEMFGDHEEKPKTATEVAEESAVDKAVIQGIYFTRPSSKIYGVREHHYGQPVVQDNVDYSHAWRGSGNLRRTGAIADMDVPESIISPALMKMRRAFTDNKRGAHLRNRKSGRVNSSVLGRRAWSGDERLFQKNTRPGKKDYFVILSMDISGSTVGRNLALEKRAIMAQATILDRAGITFAIYAHTGNYHDQYNLGLGFDLEVYHIKDPKEPWTDKQKERLANIKSSSANLDGHALEFMRKVCDTRPETDKIIMYYSDGQMPAENYSEELSILTSEINTCGKKGYTLLGVGIRTDSPRAHGLDTVEVHEDSDLIKVVTHLGNRLSEAQHR